MGWLCIDLCGSGVGEDYFEQKMVATNTPLFKIRAIMQHKISRKSRENNLIVWLDNRFTQNTFQFMILSKVHDTIILSRFPVSFLFCLNFFFRWSSIYRCKAPPSSQFSPCTDFFTVFSIKSSTQPNCGTCIWFSPIFFWLGQGGSTFRGVFVYNFLSCSSTIMFFYVDYHV